jgi:PAS domain S-box-containing protein
VPGKTILSSIAFDALFDASPNPYVLLDPGLNLVGMNEAYLRVTMRERADLIGRNMFDAFPSDPQSEPGRQLRESFARVLRERRRDHIPLIRYDIPRPDGALEERYWSATHTPLLGEDGEVLCILQHTVDVTELHRLRTAVQASAQAPTHVAQIESQVFRRAQQAEDTRRALAEERDQLRQLFEQAPGFMAVLIGPDHIFTLANMSYLALIGHRDVVGKPLRDALPEMASQGFAALMDQVYRTGQPYVGRGVRVLLQPTPSSAPEECFLDFVYQPIFGRERDVIGIFVQGHDLTEQKRAEQALQESEERFRLVAESAPVMLWMGDVEGRCLYINWALRKFWGIEPDAVDGFDWSTTIHPDDRDRLYEPFGRAMSKAESFSVEARFRRADGEYRLIHTKAQPRFDPDGEFAGMIGVNVDITETRRAEVALEQLVAERTEQLRRNEEALRQSQKMEAVGKLTGGVAHDFNNLLQVISGNLQLLAKDIAGNERAEQRLSNALGGVSRGSKLAAQLLAFGRRQPLVPKVVNLGRLVARLDDILRRAVGEAVELETIAGGGLWNTLADPTQVENALLNLAINARDAMGGVGRLTIETGNASLDEDYAARNADIVPGQYVMLAVTDTGSGMTSDVLEHAFEPFFTTKPEGQGTGLGLSQVYGFVKQSGGHIKIYSEPGQGTTVRIYLPRTREEEDVAVDVEAAPVVGGTETILVVEDDESVRATVVDTLADLGYRVLKARDALSALAIVDSGVHIDLLFTDVVMPGPLRSPDLARKARGRLPDIAVLFTSGYTENAIVHGGRLDAGINLLSKPYTREALARKIREVLRGGRQPDLPDALAPEPSGPLRSLRVLVVEDDALIRMSTVDMLETLGHVVLDAGSAADAAGLLAREPIDVLVTDIRLPDKSGTELALGACRSHPAIKVVFASGYEAASLPAELAGRAVALLKPYGEDELDAALRRLIG